MFLPDCCWCWTGLAGGLYLVLLCPWTNLKAGQQLSTMGEKVQGRLGLPFFFPLLFFALSFPKAIQFLVNVIPLPFCSALFPTHTKKHTQIRRNLLSFISSNYTNEMLVCETKWDTTLRSVLSICLAFCTKDCGGWNREAVYEYDNDKQK